MSATLATGDAVLVATVITAVARATTPTSVTLTTSARLGLPLGGGGNVIRHQDRTLRVQQLRIHVPASGDKRTRRWRERR